MSTVTVRDVAREAGVSSGTVSRVMNGREDVSPDLRDRVRKAASHLGYAGSTRKTRDRTDTDVRDVAFLLALPHVEAAADAPAPFWAHILSGCEAEARRHGRVRVSYRAVRQDESAGEIAKALLESGIGGALLVGVATAPVAEAVSLLGIPAIAIEDRPSTGTYEAVVSDYVTAGELSTNALLERGHRTIGFIGGRYAATTRRNMVWAIEARAVGYRNALSYAGIDFDEDLTEGCDLTPSGGRAAALSLLRRRPDITAIFCSNDPTAAGVLQAAVDLRLQVPSSLAVVGCDDEYAGHTFPPLATVQVARAGLGEFGLRRLLHRMAGEDDTGAVTHMLPVQFIERDSLG